MQNHINAQYLSDPIMALRWYRPESENEFKLIELLRDALALQDDIDQLQSDNEEMQADLEKLQTENADLLEDCNNQTDLIKELEAQIERLA